MVNVACCGVKSVLRGGRAVGYQAAAASVFKLSIAIVVRCQAAVGL
jgi:hypothetical protein